ncbi:uncharacterized protein L969DRAFT_97175 [Mixia osmundae IAM 14324]|uniref:Uncharacterized protein n=1 Tax=Mixia osmundae (strain CBS 9802 / IAM 14324 / JCM 22182 / KY 12970) TaxID=764103 RepID=G7DW57_MIXOS|nr:uncharacterized protein L969DRAFT_97175 [Mixia osmundae IAM 14324]KEI36440.1 hypothetical protein L969DRAFT_97175 [Mixia osmundae IAM 14324]GAA94863.1 hypothetical protein E5Q_01517 [Mixia osmundae IAM 14324]
MRKYIETKRARSLSRSSSASSSRSGSVVSLSALDTASNLSPPTSVAASDAGDGPGKGVQLGPFEERQFVYDVKTDQAEYFTPGLARLEIADTDARVGHNGAMPSPNLARGIPMSRDAMPVSPFRDVTPHKSRSVSPASSISSAPSPRLRPSSTWMDPDYVGTYILKWRSQSTQSILIKTPENELDDPPSPSGTISAKASHDALKASAVSADALHHQLSQSISIKPEPSVHSSEHTDDLHPDPSIDQHDLDDGLPDELAMTYHRKAGSVASDLTAQRLARAKTNRPIPALELLMPSDVILGRDPSLRSIETDDDEDDQNDSSDAESDSTTSSVPSSFSSSTSSDENLYATAQTARLTPAALEAAMYRSSLPASALDPHSDYLPTSPGSDGHSSVDSEPAVVNSLGLVAQVTSKPAPVAPLAPPHAIPLSALSPPGQASAPLPKATSIAFAPLPMLPPRTQPRKSTLPIGLAARGRVLREQLQKQKEQREAALNSKLSYMDHFGSTAQSSTLRRRPDFDRGDMRSRPSRRAAGSSRPSTQSHRRNNRQRAHKPAIRLRPSHRTQRRSSALQTDSDSDSDSSYMSVDSEEDLDERRADSPNAYVHDAQACIWQDRPRAEEFDAHDEACFDGLVEHIESSESPQGFNIELIDQALLELDTHKSGLDVLMEDAGETDESMSQTSSQDDDEEEDTVETPRATPGSQTPAMSYAALLSPPPAARPIRQPHRISQAIVKLRPSERNVNLHYGL